MGERVEFPSNGHTTPGYLARPGQPGPGIIVIQEWWGLVPHIEQIADRFADAGFVALAPDLYHGEKATSPDQAGKLMMALRIEDAAEGSGRRDRLPLVSAGRDAQESRDDRILHGRRAVAVRGLSELGSRRVRGVLRWSSQREAGPEITAGAGARHLCRQGRVRHTGERRRARPQLTALGKRHEFHRYPDADHAFFNDQRPEVYDASAAADAWAKTLALFRRELQVR